MFDTLRTFPQTLRKLVSAVPEERLRVRGEGGTFAAIEQAWHLADLEVEGYGVRIARILGEHEPALEDFRGDVVAEERKYRELELEPALRRFADARERNVEALENAADLQRAGNQEGVGRVTLARIAEMMAEHDAGHAAELQALRG
ncbi:MAG TPA: DinB family protein [Thermoanaerobaculia bacterium]|nr:DinB family protein [Thermoanaerobaculia bacterium]